MKHASALKFTVISGLLALIAISCGKQATIRDVIRDDRQSFYYVDFGEYPAGNSSLPIGVFDSGTGGLSVLADIIEHDGLANESYIFLGDLANMPYGSYALENNTALLIEHVFKDMQFLLGNRYYRSAGSGKYETDKSQVKAIVVACNTATAYAPDTIKRFLEEAGCGTTARLPTITSTGVLRVISRNMSELFRSAAQQSRVIFLTGCRNRYPPSMT